MAAPVLREDHGSVAILRLNRPDRLNAVSLALYEALRAELKAIDADPALRAVILTGTGRAFCVGADLKAHGEGSLTDEERRRYVETGQTVYRTLQTLSKPVVAAVNGHAIGAGVELALSCDLIVVAADAKLRLPELHLGTFVGGGTVYTLADRVGLGKARELMLLGETFLGADAARMGLANEATDAESVVPRARVLAERLARAAPVPMAHARRLLDAARWLHGDTAMAEEGRALLDCMGTADWAEGVNAFRDKRDPEFHGR